MGEKPAVNISLTVIVPTLYRKLINGVVVVLK